CRRKWRRREPRVVAGCNRPLRRPRPWPVRATLPAIPRRFPRNGARLRRRPFGLSNSRRPEWFFPAAVRFLSVNVRVWKSLGLLHRGIRGGFGGSGGMGQMHLLHHDSGNSVFVDQLLLVAAFQNQGVLIETTNASTEFHPADEIDGY